MSEVDPVYAASALNRTMVNGEDHSVALPQRHDLGARLHAGTLLGQHELAAGEVSSRLRQQDRDLQRKDMLAVEILVQAVVVIRPVLEQKRCRSDLPGCMATSQKIGMRLADTARRCPVPHSIDWQSAPAAGRTPSAGRQQLGQRIREVLVFAAPITMPRHDDTTAKAVLVTIQPGHRPAFVRETAGARARRRLARREPVKTPSQSSPSIRSAMHAGAVPARTVSGPAHSCLCFSLEEGVLALDAPSVTRQRAIVLHHAMARYRHCQGIRCAGLRHSSYRFRRADPVRNLRVTRG